MKYKIDFLKKSKNLIEKICLMKILGGYNFFEE